MATKRFDLAGLKKDLLAAIKKYAKAEGTDFDCAFRDALADMRHIAGDHKLDYHLEDLRAEGLYKEECADEQA
jgi:hypothetical protein